MFAAVSAVLTLAATGASVVLLGAGLGCLRSTWRVGLSLQSLGLLLIGVSGVAVVLGTPAAGSGFHDGFIPAFGIDRLSGFFLAILGLVGAPAALQAREGLVGVRGARAIAVLTGLFTLALAGLLLSRDVTTFLAFWELMTLLPASAILVARSDVAARRDTFYYVAVTHIGGAGVWVAMLLLARHHVLSGGPLEGGGLRALITVAAMIGFGTKAGLAPLHTWLPRAHPIAPPHISALMSGVMVNIALYGLIRVLFQWTAPTPVWVGLVLLAAGAVSAVAGIGYAVFQRELKRLLAFCTVENVGLISLGLGASLVFAAIRRPLWSELAFAAAMLQLLIHALAKGLMFLVAGALTQQVGRLDLNHLGGLLSRMPWTGGAFMVGAVTLAGVPPLAGFASEWTSLQALLHVGLLAHAGVAAAGVLAAALLVVAAALSVLAFTTATGLTLLGQPRRIECEEACDPSITTRAALVFLAACSVALALLPGLLLPRLAALQPKHAATLGVRPRPGIDLPLTGTLPTLGLTLSLLVVVVLLWAAARGRRTAPSPAWAGGQHFVPALAWTEAGFTKTLRLMFEGALRPRRELTTDIVAGVLRSIRFESEIPHRFETQVYAPAIRLALRIAGAFRRLQSGSLPLYLGYLLGLLFVLLILIRVGVLS
jgi:hydrogenase-4 component B